MVYPGQIRYCVGYTLGSLSGKNDMVSFSGSYANEAEAKDVYNKVKRRKDLINATLSQCVFNENLDLQPLGIIEKVEKNLLKR